MTRFRDWCFSFYARYLSQPAGERVLFRHLRRHAPRRIVELGMGDGSRAKRVLDFLHRATAVGEIRYAGIDSFEAGPYAAEGWSLKVAHQELKQRAQVRLWPGDPLSVLSRQANGLAETDLILVGETISDEAWESCWRFLPRMLHEHTAIFVAEVDLDDEETQAAVEEGPEDWSFRQLTAAEIESLCGSQQRHIRRAA